MDANLSVALEVIKYHLEECQEQVKKRLFDYGRSDVRELRRLLDDAEDLALKIDRSNT